MQFFRLRFDVCTQTPIPVSFLRHTMLVTASGQMEGDVRMEKHKRRHKRDVVCEMSKVEHEHGGHTSGDEDTEERGRGMHTGMRFFVGKSCISLPSRPP